MDDFDDHVIPYEEAVRRHRAIEEAQRQKGVIREVKISDALDHLLEEEKAPDEDGLSPAVLRRIVEREFADEGGRSGPEPEERPRPHLVTQPERRTPGAALRLRDAHVRGSRCAAGGAAAALRASRLPLVAAGGARSPRPTTSGERASRCFYDDALEGCALPGDDRGPAVRPGGVRGRRRRRP